MKPWLAAITKARRVWSWALEVSARIFYAVQFAGSGGIPVGCREQGLGAVPVETVSRCFLVRAQTSCLSGYHLARALSRPGDDVHDPNKGVRAIQRRAWAAHNFDAIYKVHIDREVVSDGRRIIDVVIDRVAVHQKEDAAVGVSRRGKPSHSESAVAAVILNIESRSRYAAPPQWSGTRTSESRPQ